MPNVTLSGDGRKQPDLDVLRPIGRDVTNQAERPLARTSERIPHGLLDEGGAALVRFDGDIILDIPTSNP